MAEVEITEEQQKTVESKMLTIFESQIKNYGENKIADLNFFRQEFYYHFLGPNGPQIITQQLKKFTAAKDLSLNILNGCSKFQFGVGGITALAECLKEFKSLTKLSLNVAQNEIGNEGTDILAKSLSELKNLEKLNLEIYFSKIKGQGMNAIADLIINLPKLTHLELSIGSNEFEVESSERLSNALKSCKNLKALYLKLTYLGMDNAVAKHLSDAIQHLATHNTITEFSILSEGNSSIEEEGQAALINSITQLKHLTKYHLQAQTYKLHEQNLIQKITSQLQNLQNLTELSLDIYENNIESKEFSDLVEAFSKATQLRKLMLKFFCNKGGNPLADALANTLKGLIHLEDLNLQIWQNQIGEESAIKVISSLSNLKQLKKLDFGISNCELTGTAAPVIVETLQSLPNLVELLLSVEYNKIDTNSLTNILNQLKTMNKLKKLEYKIYGNPFTYDEYSVISDQIFDLTNGIDKLSFEEAKI